MGDAMSFRRLSEINKERDKITSEMKDLQNDLVALEQEAKEIVKSSLPRQTLIVYKILERASSYYDTESYDLVICFDTFAVHRKNSYPLVCTLYNEHEKHLVDAKPISTFHLSIPFSWLELDEGLLHISMELAAINRHRDFYDWLNRFCKPEQNRG